MELLEVLQSKVGQKIKVLGLPRMTSGCIDAIRLIFVRDYRNSHLISTIQDTQEYDVWRDKLILAIQATGDELISKRGKWTVRFRKELKSQGILVTDQMLGRIGDTIMQYTESDGPWFVDIVSKLDWNPGNFGDEGSCYWSCRSNCRDMMEFYHGLAIRTYRSDEYERGSGRCWIAKPNINNPNYDTIVLFNAYGKNLDKFAHILTRMFELDNIVVHSREIDMFNDYGDFWINNGRGHVISDNERVERLDSINLNYINIHGHYHWVTHIDENLPKCCKCGEIVLPTVDNPIIENGSILSLTDGNSIYCDKCISIYAKQFCTRCSRNHLPDHFIKDANSHEFCVWSMRWYGICECGHVAGISCTEFNQTGDTLDFSMENLSQYCYSCHRHSIKYLFGPMCPDCDGYVRREFGNCNHTLSTEEFVNIFSRYSLKQEAK